MATAMEKEEESFEAFEEADFITLMPKETIASQVGCLRSLYELRARIGSNARDARVRRRTAIHPNRHHPIQ